MLKSLKTIVRSSLTKGTSTGHPRSVRSVTPRGRKASVPLCVEPLEGRTLMSVAVINYGPAPSESENLFRVDPGNILPETAVNAPGAVEFKGSLFVAWSGTDSAHHLNVMCILPGGSSAKVTLGDTSPVGASLAVFKGRLYLAWSGTGNQQLNVMSSGDGFNWSDKVTLGETSFARPVLTEYVYTKLTIPVHTLVLGWVGTDPAHRLNTLSSPDGKSWGGKHTLDQTSIDAPALASYQGQLYIAWTGTNSAHNLNVMSSPNGGATWGPKKILRDTSIAGPSLYAGARLELAWAGRDASQRINHASSSDGITFGDKTTLSDTSDFTPVLTGAFGFSELVWTGRDDQHHLNIMPV